ncbi:Calx-beta domain-containing protein, partial [Arthrospira platensis SPKY1]|nr:Calx-beta domain-containing protein [Arthrospira platensis SPKY1]
CFPNSANSFNSHNFCDVERIGRIREASSVTVELSGITAVPGIDFEPEEITINFQPDQISQTVPITILGNLVTEPNRNLRLSLVPAEGELVGEENPTAELIIIDDDDIPTYDFSRSIFERSEER